MKELSDLLNNHMLEIEALQDKIDDLKAYKDLSIYLVNMVGFDSVPNLCDYIRTDELRIENNVIRDLLAARWSNRDKPIDLVIDEIVERKIIESNTIKN
jgi:hypothetical protein